MRFRIGLGTDLHRLQPGNGLRLGGFFIPCEYSCIAMSDGDVLLHSVTDALLGALALGDLGDHFPESKVTHGEDSRRFVRETLQLLANLGARPINVDCVVDLERPRLSPWKNGIRQSLADALGIPFDCASVKAKTAEGFGDIGQSRAIAAQAVVLVEAPENA